jgi:ADP-ribosylglycohydrolase
MFQTSLLADSLALGPHWIYDRKEIATRFPNLNALHAPATNYHPGKQAGDQSHVGDQAVLLAQSLVATKGEPDTAHFMAHWRSFWSLPTTQTYKDKATKQVLESQTPSPSTELAGVARCGALAQLLVKRGMRGDSLARELYTHVSLTHNSELSKDATARLAGVLTQIAEGRDWRAELPADTAPTLTTGDALEKIGQSCDAAVALPAVWLLLRRHSADPEKALIENALAGGDSAARGLFLGIILGAAGAKLPDTWRTGLRARPVVEQLGTLS